MSLRNRFVVPFVLAVIAVLGACGSGTHNAVPPPTGGFSNTNFNGTYTFSILGADVNGPMTIAGSIVACGCDGGTISSGTVDLIDPLGPATAQSISNGSYTIQTDGRGSARFVIPTAGGNVNAVFDFVLTSSSHGLIVRYDGSATGSGTIDLQPAAVAQSAIANSYAFSLNGTDLGGNPLSTVGSITLDSNGVISQSGSTAGVQDINYLVIGGGGVVFPELQVSGSVRVGTGTIPGMAAISTSAFGLFTFDVYAIDSTHLKLIESDGNAIWVGDAFLQGSTAAPNGNFVFTMSGFDTLNELPFVVGGLMSSDGSTISGGLEDVSENGTVDQGGGTATPSSFTGALAPTGSGRFAMNLSNFAGAANFAAYPSSGGLLLLQIDTGLNQGITGGVALQQTSTTLSANGYGLNLTGFDLNPNVLGEMDETGEFVASATGMTGLLDENDSGSTSTKNIGGTYTVASNGSGVANNFSSGLGGMLFYTADSSTALFISTDPNQTALGLFQVQSTPTDAAASLSQQHLAMVRSVSRTHSAKGKGKRRLGLAKN